MDANTPNVDKQELDKFNSIASSWWEPEGEFKPLHKLNPVRLAYIQERAKDLANKFVLDIGCGGGILAESMAKVGATVTGIDLAQDSLNVAKLHALESKLANLDYEMVSAEQYASEHAETFDVVTCMEMLEHVPEPESIVESAARLCKPGGKVFFSTLNKTAKSYLLAILGAEKVLKLVPEGTHEFEKFIKPAQLITWAEKHGLKVRHSIGLHYNPLTEVFSLKPNVDVNYILYCEKI
jgi:2-polyprenyl-6-hydroxyphenyl methylase/3-demethylubiquinone-9 3-methyltransferase